MTCEQARPLLSAYHDRELDVTKSLEIEGHLQACERCAAVVRQYEALRGALTATSLTFAPPRGLERRVRKTVGRATSPGNRFALPWLRWAGVATAATLAVALFWGVAVNRVATSAEEHFLADLVSGHVRSLMVDHLVDVATSDRHTVKPWFNGKVEFAPPVSDFTASGFPLLGGRLDYIAGRPTAVLVYRRNQHLVNVFIWPSGNEPGQALQHATLQGYQLLRWSRSGLTFWAVSDVNTADLEALAHLFQEAG